VRCAASRRDMSTGRLRVGIWPQRQVRGSTVLSGVSVNARTPQRCGFLENVDDRSAVGQKHSGWLSIDSGIEHAIERAVILAPGATIRVRELPPEVSQKSRPRAATDSLDLQEHEGVMIERAGALPWQSATSRAGFEDQHRYALTQDETVRPRHVVSSTSIALVESCRWRTHLRSSDGEISPQARRSPAMPAGSEA
jgi:hypothetical protein